MGIEESMNCVCVREKEIHTVLGNIERMHSPPFRIKLGKLGCFIVAPAATRTPGAADGQGGTCKSFYFDLNFTQCH